jgi:hypothetical protein
MEVKSFYTGKKQGKTQCTRARQSHGAPSELTEFLRDQKPNATQGKKSITNDPNQRNWYTRDLTCPTLVYYITV